MNTGKVWLVGAGPGDPGLFTVKGKEILGSAEVVVYDSLVGQGVLSQIPKEAKAINVGKRASHHTMPQEKINQVLVEEAKKGYRVVRLKGGDPFLFGRGGEELELLTKEGIPYEVVPGVTSPIAVPAYNGIPVTHRDYTSSLHIITGHKKQGEAYDIDFKALVDTKGTLVFLMGVTALPDICASLLAAGMDPEMPAAVLQQGTTAGQKRIVSTVAELPEEVKRQGVETPAIIVVGRVCALADEFAWYEKLPLAGRKILVTRPKDLISSMSAKLRALGAEVLELPAIRTEPLEDQGELYQAFKELDTYDWAAFTSPTGVSETGHTGNGYVRITAVEIYPTVPKTPTNIRQTSSDYFSLTIAWDAVECDGYKIYRDGVLQSTQTSTSYKDTDVEPNGVYTYEVLGYNSNGNGKPASIVAKTLEAITATIPIIDSAIVEPQVLNTRQQFTITVTVSEITRILLPEQIFSGEIFSGEL